MRKPPRLKMLGPIAGLLLVMSLAVVFSVGVVQLQASATAYVSGQSIWAQAQLATVHYLDRYAETGDPAELTRARAWHKVPLADMHARQAMDASPPDWEEAGEYLVQGDNHPDDISRMLWLYRYFSEAPYLRHAASVWRDSDPYIIELSGIAEALEAEHAAAEPSEERIAQLRDQLTQLNDELVTLTTDFRHAMTDAARWLTGLLSVVSLVFLSVLAAIAWWLGSRLLKTMARAENKFRATFQNAAVGMAQVDDKGKVLDANQALCDILRHPKERVLGMYYPELIHPEDWELSRQQRKDIRSGAREDYTVEQRLLCGDGNVVWGKITVSAIREAINGSVRYVAIMEDVSESRRLTIELDYQATHDDLTGLSNRRAFGRNLAEFLRRARQDHSEHALCLIDLDQFKVVNDTSGHVAGDQMLCQVAKILGENLRDGDVLARLGSDEFALILEKCDLDSGARVAEKLRGLLENSNFIWEDTSYRMGCSIGVVPITAASTDTNSLLRAADIACYLAKEQGRNRVYVSQEDDQQLAEHQGEMQWLGRIRTALDEDRFFLDAQRLVCLDKPGCCRYEVLVRLRDEDGNVVPPGAFLPAAERFGAVVQIDRWVIEEVCRQLAAHKSHTTNLEACHINLSGRSFDQENFADFVLDVLDRYQVPGEKICFEITETAAVSNMVDVIAFMDRLRARGCTFALDDFGAGLSSFGYLRRLSVEYLKIDGVFVRDIATDETDLAMVRAINEIGQTLNKKIVAEFVETAEALELLRSMGVHYVQGYHTHRPCRFAELLTAG